VSTPHRGVLVTIDGPSGAGKTTAVKGLRVNLARRGFSVYATTQPSRATLGEIARHQTETFRGLSLACLVAADRYHHLETEIRPKRDAGYIVICDRYVASSYVLQRMDGVPLEFVAALNAEADVPDLAVILTTEPAIAAERVARRGPHDRFHAGIDTSAQESELYRQAVEQLGTRGYQFVTIDTNGADAEQIAQRLGDYVAALVDGPGSEPATA